MTQEPKPTPTPWYAIQEEDGAYSVASTPNGDYGTSVTGWGRVRQTKADAEFIVQACNSHAGLLATLKECEEFVEVVDGRCVLWQRIQAAIQKAEPGWKSDYDRENEAADKGEPTP